MAAVSIAMSAAAVPCQLALLAGIGSLQGKRLEAVVTHLCRSMAQFICMCCAETSMLGQGYEQARVPHHAASSRISGTVSGYMG